MMMLRRTIAIAIIAVVVVGAIATGYVILGRQPPSKSIAKPIVIVLHIPRGSSAVPPGFNSVSFQENFPTGSYPYPVKITVVIGVNNTVEWINDDGVGHTVTALVAPNDQSKFNSGLILAGGTFNVTLTVPGVYRYTCAWHNWLAGQVTLDPA